MSYEVPVKFQNVTSEQNNYAVEKHRRVEGNSYGEESEARTLSSLPDSQTAIYILPFMK